MIKTIDRESNYTNLSIVDRLTTVNAEFFLCRVFL